MTSSKRVYPNIPQPPANLVVAGLEAFSETSPTKQKGWLAVAQEDSSCCFCIQGVFIKVAIDLGLPATFKSPDGRTFALSVLVPKDVLTNARYLVTRSFWESSVNAPSYVFKFLGVPNTVTPDDLALAGLYKKLPASFHGAGACNYVWSTLNDMTELSLGELINLAIQLVKKGAAINN